MASPYSFRAGPVALGIGVENMALIQPGLAQFSNYYGARYNVRSNVDVSAPAFVKTTVEGPAVALRGNGVYMSDGDIALQSLIEFNRGQKNEV
jgi:hypothetical protein